MCTSVVDLLVEDLEARVLAVGEVKPEATAYCQVLAPLLLQKEKHGVCPVGKFVMWLTVNTSTVCIGGSVRFGGKSAQQIAFDNHLRLGILTWVCLPHFYNQHTWADSDNLSAGARWACNPTTICTEASPQELHNISKKKISWFHWWSIGSCKPGWRATTCPWTIRGYCYSLKFRYWR